MVISSLVTEWSVNRMPFGYWTKSPLTDEMFGSAYTPGSESNSSVQQGQASAAPPIATGPTTGLAVGTLPSISEDLPLDQRVVTLERMLKDLSNMFTNKTWGDNLMMARIREELDMISNAKKEDRIILTGLTNPVPMPVDGEEKKRWLNEMVCRVFNEIDSNLRGKILFINHGKRNGRFVPMVEVRLDSRENAIALRRSFVDKKKSGHNFGKLHLANSVSLGTRVRCDILRGIATQFTVDGATSMFVSAYNSRPVIHIKESNGSAYALTFADAIARYGQNLSEDHLIDAYRKVGVAFKGQLEQHFVVLKDLEISRVSAKAYPASRQRGSKQSGSSRGGRGRTNPSYPLRTPSNQGQKRPFDYTSFPPPNGSKLGRTDSVSAPWGISSAGNNTMNSMNSGFNSQVSHQSQPVTLPNTVMPTSFNFGSTAQNPSYLIPNQILNPSFNPNPATIPAFSITNPQTTTNWN